MRRSPNRAEVLSSNLANRLGQRSRAWPANCKLQQAGMLLTQPVSLVSDGLAGIAVGGDHPQADSIEQILRADMTLERDFDRLARDYQSQCGDELMINVELK